MNFEDVLDQEKNELVEAFASKQNAEFELKYTYRSEGFKDDVCFSIEEMELN